jgi:hypothetical protein
MKHKEAIKLLEGLSLFKEECREALSHALAMLERLEWLEDLCDTAEYDMVHFYQSGQLYADEILYYLRTGNRFTPSRKSCLSCCEAEQIPGDLHIVTCELSRINKQTNSGAAYTYCWDYCQGYKEQTFGGKSDNRKIFKGNIEELFPSRPDSSWIKPEPADPVKQLDCKLDLLMLAIRDCFIDSAVKAERTMGYRLNAMMSAPSDKELEESTKWADERLKELGIVKGE